METIKSHVDYMRIKEEQSRKNTTVPEALSEEDFEEVIGSGLTSETASNKGAEEVPKQKPKTIPGKRLKDREEAKPPEKKSQKEKLSSLYHWWTRIRSQNLQNLREQKIFMNRFRNSQSAHR